MSRPGGRLVTLVGQSGSGKTTQMRKLVEANAFRQSPNITTRPSRPSDLPHEYNYLGEEEYQDLFERGELLWDAPHGGARYSKMVSEVDRVLADPANIHVNALMPFSAAILLKRYGPERVRTVFLASPGDDVLLDRMTSRGDPPDKATARLVSEEAQGWSTQSATIAALGGLVIGSDLVGIDAIHAEIADFAVS